MRTDISASVQDYLKVIYAITQQQARATTSQVAERLNHKPASVTGMLQRLAAEGLVDYRKRRGVKLTQAGHRAALTVIRHHRLIETFLHDMLGYGWDEVHAEAERLEHAVSEEMCTRIADVLGNPRHDPHGDPIPTRDLEMPSRNRTRLSDCRPGQAAVILRVQDEDPALLRHLEHLGLVPQAEVIIHTYSPFDETLTLQLAHKEETFVIGAQISSQLFVETVARA